MIAYVTPTDIPGLVDVRLDDGREFRELTSGQLTSLVRAEGWIVDGPPGTPYEQVPGGGGRP